MPVTPPTIRSTALPWLILGTFAVALVSSPSRADDVAPLHVRIDEAIRAKINTPMAARCDDAEFVRRVYLDLAGRIPSAVEARRFLADPSGDKRTRLIDRLLNSDEYPRRMQIVFDTMLMERRADSHVPSPEWQEFLVEAFRQNMPYNELVREILSSDGSDPTSRAAAKFYLDREADANLLTRDIGRIFLGMDLQCAQCHNHPLIDDYLQSDYYGLYAFVSRSYIFTAKDKTVTLAEKADGDVTFKSVFTDESGSTVPRLPDGDEVKEPAFKEGEEYVVKPADGVRPVPKYSRRARLPELLGSGDDPRFRRNIANRLWGMMMGRGIVQPYDLIHSDNPPSHPELLETLSDEFAAMNFDIKRFLRELALSETYQRSSELPEGIAAGEEPPEELYAVAILRPLSPEQLAESLMQATGALEPQREASVTEDDPRTRDLLETDDQWRSERDTLLDNRLHQRLRGQFNEFAGRFGGQPGTTPVGFEATVHQALYMANGSQVSGWLKPSAGNLVDRLNKARDPRRAADDLYLSVLSRLPTDDERREVCELFAKSAGESQQRLAELAWALLASAEFRLNH